MLVRSGSLRGEGTPLKYCTGRTHWYKIQLLAQRHVERADATAHRGGHRPLDGHGIFLEGVEGFLRQPLVGAVELGGLLAGVDLHPVNLLLAAVGLFNCGIDDLDHHRGDIHPDAVTLDEGMMGLSGVAWPGTIF
jgi:hypothetical protein